MKFELNEYEIKAADKFIDQQMLVDNQLPAAGERFSYIFTPTGIGTAVEIKDNLLYNTLNITDFENW